jgi:hypothetical protein
MNNLKVGHIYPSTIPDNVGNTDTTSSTTLHANNVIVPNTFKTDTISTPSTTAINQPSVLTINHDYINVPHTLKTDVINSVSISTTTQPTNLTMNHDNVNISGQLNVNSISPSNLYNHISVNGNSISIGNPNNPGICTIYLYGNVHNVLNTNATNYINELEGYFEQSGI